MFELPDCVVTDFYADPEAPRLPIVYQFYWNKGSRTEKARPEIKMYCPHCGYWKTKEIWN